MIIYMGRGQSTGVTVSGVSRREASLEKDFPMNGILEELAERADENDDGIFCPQCETAYPAQGGDADSRSLLANCPQHGRYSVDFSREYQELLDERIDDIPYQEFA